ncbi:hypothetical protein AB835_12190 [Candidatus Endobugula sertula]|uniref:Haloacid dehalogenase n=1 Tax=Candidatus Endobugula sertula TaxID=62101 RepID=A0A1D2QMJ5_9GAMM|nr:hypothetical protein AB835_12190 [Candidatus Endobugula sertula]
MLNQKIISPTRYAFFDVDDTVISMKSMFSFMDLYFEYYPNKVLQQQFNDKMNALIQNDTKWEIANTIYYSYFKNFSISNVNTACQKWFSKYASDKSRFYHKNVLKRLRQHQSEGAVCVFVSGSFRELLQPIANELSVKHILSINLERKDFMYTGNIIPPQTIGVGKARALTEFIEDKQADANQCFAYGDDISDIPMLEIVGNPIAVSGGRRLEAYANSLGWQVINP